MPHSEFDQEIIGKFQHDITNENQYKKLSFLPPNTRLFLVSQPLTPLLPEPPFDFRRINATLYAVEPVDKRIVKLASTSDFKKMPLQIRTKREALSFVQMLSDFSTGSREVVRFNGMGFMEIPANTGCVSVSQIPLKKAGVRKPIVRKLYSADNEQYFEITRYMLPRYVQLGFGDSYTFDSVSRITEHVAINGAYSMTSESVSSPGLSVENQCGAL
jgi:hypothetical protein